MEHMLVQIVNVAWIWNFHQRRFQERKGEIVSSSKDNNIEMLSLSIDEYSGAVVLIKVSDLRILLDIFKECLTNVLVLK